MNDTHFGYQKIDLDDKQGAVNGVFQSVAPSYDKMNDVMSLGLHRLWKDALVSKMAPPKSARPFQVLDVAGGSGDITHRVLKRSGRGTHVTLTDINPHMLDEAKQRLLGEGFDDRLLIREANAESLPFDDECFDCVTIAFGLRNVPRTDVALAEFRRVLKPGGMFLCLEFSRVETPLIDQFYDVYSFHLIPRLGQVIAGDGEAYQYLVESIRMFPDAPDLAEMMRVAGFQDVQFRRMTFGVVALHIGRVPR